MGGLGRAGLVRTRNEKLREGARKALMLGGCGAAGPKDSEGASEGLELRGGPTAKAPGRRQAIGRGRSYRIPVATAAPEAQGPGAQVGAPAEPLQKPPQPHPSLAEAALTCQPGTRGPPGGDAPPRPAPGARPGRRLRVAGSPEVTTTWLRRRGCSSGCSCSGRPGGCRASGAQPQIGASRSTNSARTTNAAVSAPGAGGRGRPRRGCAGAGARRPRWPAGGSQAGRAERRGGCTSHLLPASQFRFAD